MMTTISTRSSRKLPPLPQTTKEKEKLFREKKINKMGESKNCLKNLETNVLLTFAARGRSCQTLTWLWLLVLYLAPSSGWF